MHDAIRNLLALRFRLDDPPPMAGGWKGGKCIFLITMSGSDLERGVVHAGTLARLLKLDILAYTFDGWYSDDPTVRLSPNPAAREAAFGFAWTADDSLGEMWVLSRDDRGRVTVEPQTVDPNPVLSALVESGRQVSDSLEWALTMLDQAGHKVVTA